MKYLKIHINQHPVIDQSKDRLCISNNKLGIGAKLYTFFGTIAYLFNYALKVEFKSPTGTTKIWYVNAKSFAKRCINPDFFSCEEPTKNFIEKVRQQTKQKQLFTEQDHASSSQSTSLKTKLELDQKTLSHKSPQIVKTISPDHPKKISSESVQETSSDLKETSTILPQESSSEEVTANSNNLEQKPSLEATESPQKVESELPLEKPFSLAHLFARTPLSEGVNLKLLNEEEHQAMSQWMQKWWQREDLDKPDWTIKELSVLLDVSTEELKELYYRLQLFQTPNSSLTTQSLDRLFKSINRILNKVMTFTLTPSVQGIWDRANMTRGLARVSIRGLDKETWSPDDLSMFLSVDKDVLQYFLLSKHVETNTQGDYKSEEIDQALKSAENYEINTILETNRTQLSSVRFAGD